MKRCLLPLLLLLVSASCSTVTRGVRAEGVVVEEVEKGSPLAQTGLAKGDILVGWEDLSSQSGPGITRGRFISPFDVNEVEIERAPRGQLRLQMLLDCRNPSRASCVAGKESSPWRPASALVPAGKWGVTTASRLPAEYQKVYDEARELVKAGSLDEGVQLMETLIGKSPEHAPSLLLTIARAHAGKKKWSAAATALDRAIAAAGADRNAIRQLLLAKGETLASGNDIAGAVETYGRALAGSDAPTLFDATLLNARGRLFLQRSEFAGARKDFEAAMEISERLAPQSLLLAGAYSGLGRIARRVADPDGAEKYYQKSLSLQTRLAPDSPDLATTWNDLGNLAWDRGNIEAAEKYHRKALALRERLTPGKPSVAASLGNLANLASYRGEDAAAEQLFLQALAIFEKNSPGSAGVAATLTNLGNIAEGRGDHAEAERLHRRALEIDEKLAPASLNVAADLNNLATVLRGSEQLAPAEELYRKALAIYDKLSPHSLPTSKTAHELAVVLVRSRKLVPARDLLLRALAIRERLAPGSSKEAETLHELGGLDRLEGKLESAAGFFSRAIDALESQKVRLGGSEDAKATFASRFAVYYRDYAELLIELGKKDQAFHVIERSRARALLAMLAQRDLVLSHEVPPELEAERTKLDLLNETEGKELAKRNPVTEEAEIDRALARLRELRGTRDQLAEKIRITSPRYAGLQLPQPLTIDETRRFLDPQTLLVTYAVGARTTMLFAVQPGLPLTVHTLAIGESDLKKRVGKFRNLIARRTDHSALRQQGAELYELLLAPVDRLLDASRRVVVSADGPLHLLPFAALVRRQRYLAEWKPIHHVVSATVYRQLVNQRAESQHTIALEAFGDPSYPSDPSAAPAEVRALDLLPLPASRGEVVQIASLFGPSARALVGTEASETRAKALGRDVRYIHFASHGILDENLPLNSSLALTTDGSDTKENGLLQAWEIFEKMRIDADLVTLSACETALGKEVAGEGLIGLTRAFQYAGARSVLASLWSVSDESTAGLMKHVYSFLRSGISKDEALRRAQLELIRDEVNFHPFHWAAFQLVGDWK